MAPVGDQGLLLVPSVHRRTDGLGRDRGVLVFPDAYDLPPCLAELGVGVSVSFDVASKFRLPPLAVAFRNRSMDWTAVPETTIDENGNFGLGEHHIRGAPEAW